MAIVRKAVCHFLVGTPGAGIVALPISSFESTSASPLGGFTFACFTSRSAGLSSASSSAMGTATASLPQRRIKPVRVRQGPKFPSPKVRRLRIGHWIMVRVVTFRRRAFQSCKNIHAGVCLSRFDRCMDGRPSVTNDTAGQLPALQASFIGFAREAAMSARTSTGAPSFNRA